MVYYCPVTHLQERFIANLRYYRTHRSLSQAAFSKKVGISPNYLNAVENGKNFPSPEVLQKMADELDVMPYELFLESTDKADSDTKLEQVLSALKDRMCSLFDNAVTVK